MRNSEQILLLLQSNSPVPFFKIKYNNSFVIFSYNTVGKPENKFHSLYSDWKY